MKRRDFLRNTGMTGVVMSSGLFPLGAMGSADIVELTILHTNDVHSRLDPWPMDGSRNAGQGGAARRAHMINMIRSERRNVLLFDAGDIFQGTPYFNLFGGEVEFKVMSAMGYDGATIGNHDFDAGIDGLERQLVHADFPFIICNYDMSDTVMAGKTREYKVFEVEGVRIGVLGLGIELEGLVPASLYGATQYLDPVEHAQRVTNHLKREEACDFVVCLSHLGYKYRGGYISDVVLAEQTTDIDLIIGGHTHTFLNEPDIVSNADGKPVCVNQVGWGGLRLGRIDLAFEKGKAESCLTCQNLWVRD